jgi:hypothetical protein
MRGDPLNWRKALASRTTSTLHTAFTKPLFTVFSSGAMNIDPFTMLLAQTRHCTSAD